MQESEGREEEECGMERNEVEDESADCTEELRQGTGVRGPPYMMSTQKGDYPILHSHSY